MILDVRRIGPVGRARPAPVGQRQAVLLRQRDDAVAAHRLADLIPELGLGTVVGGLQGDARCPHDGDQPQGQDGGGEGFVERIANPLYQPDEDRVRERSQRERGDGDERQAVVVVRRDVIVEENREGEVRAPQTEEEDADGFVVDEEQTEESECKGEEAEDVADHLRPAEIKGWREEKFGHETSAELLAEKAAREAVRHPCRAGQDAEDRPSPKPACCGRGRAGRRVRGLRRAPRR